MSIISALHAGASGMTSLAKSIQVTGNNIANVNTVAFKASRVEFSDLLSQAINTPSGKKQLGRGVRVSSVQGLFHQGSFESTSVVTDVALNGAGYFVVRDDTDVYFTRQGTFRIDKDGILTNPLGMYVDGYIFDERGQSTGTQGPIDLSQSTAPPNQTGDGVADGTGVSLNVNLDSRLPVEAVFDPANAESTSNFSTSLTVYDSLGNGHSTMVFFNKTADNEWEWHALVDGAEVTGGTPGTFEEEASGTLSFDANGELINQTVAAGSQFDFVGGAEQGQIVGFDFGGTTQVASAAVTNSIQQDGYGPGELQAIDVGTDGVITGIFSNGRVRDLAQLVVASFPAETELFRVGDSLFVESVDSGQPVFGVASSGTNGTVAASTLELSNVEISHEFVKLITDQRGFQANSKIVTASDEMLETVINMKR